MRTLRNDNFSFIDVDEADVAYCPRCEQVGIYQRLGERLYEEGVTNIPEDHDNWCQCHRCGLVLEIYNRKQSGQFSYFKDTVSNPFDSTSQFEATKKRGKKNRLKDYKEEDYNI